MNAQELRIGNYVSFKFKPFDIDDPIYRVECGADIWALISPFVFYSKKVVY